MNVFWRLAYAFYKIAGRAVSSRRSRIPELATLSLAVLLAASWAYALATNHAANLAGLPTAAAIVGTLALAGLFFRHVRHHSADDAHYLQKRASSR